jgi:hypothetical protein
VEIEHLDNAELESLNSDIRLARIAMHDNLMTFAYKTPEGAWRLRRHISSLTAPQSELWARFKQLGASSVEVQSEQSRRRKAVHAENMRNEREFNWHREYAKEARKFLSNAQHEEIVDVLSARQDLLDREIT